MLSLPFSFSIPPPSHSLSFFRPAQVVHGNYMPLTPRKQRGFFDIVMKRDKGELDDGLKSTRSAREFSHFLDNLPLGKR